MLRYVTGNAEGTPRGWELQAWNLNSVDAGRQQGHIEGVVAGAQVFSV